MLDNRGEFCYTMDMTKKAGAIARYDEMTAQIRAERDAMNTIIRKNLHKNILAWRAHLKMTQAELARRMGVDQTVVVRLEKYYKRLKRAPHMATVERVAHAFGITPEDLIMKKPPKENE